MQKRGQGQASGLQPIEPVYLAIRERNVSLEIFLIAFPTALLTSVTDIPVSSLQVVVDQNETKKS
jgi:hypothetical protein